MLVQDLQYGASVTDMLSLQHYKGCGTLAEFLSQNCRLFCRGQIGLKFVGTSPCHTLADFLSRLTTSRLGVESICSTNSSLVEVRARQFVLVQRTLADKVRHDILRSSTVRYRPTSPNLVADLSEFTAHQPTYEDFLSADKKKIGQCAAALSLRSPEHLVSSRHNVKRPVRHFSFFPATTSRVRHRLKLFPTKNCAVHNNER